MHRKQRQVNEIYARKSGKHVSVSVQVAYRKPREVSPMKRDEGAAES